MVAIIGALTLVGCASIMGESKLGCEIGSGNDTKYKLLTPTECQAENVHIRAEFEAQQAEENRKAVERSDDIQTQRGVALQKYKEEIAEHVKKDARNGYQVVTFNDFQLDGKELAARNAKISIAGGYIKVGDMEYLISSPVAAIMVARTGNTNDAIAILTDNASRIVRQYFLNCRNVPGIQLGCPINLLGNATMCERTNLVGTQTIPCILVRDGWNIVPPS
jgi:hypothetical protein